MRLLGLIIISLFACVACSRSAPQSADGVAPSVSTIRRYANSFTGLSMDEAKGRLADAQLREDDWEEGEFRGRQLIAEFPHYEIRVMFSNGEVITTSVLVLSD